jgi:hypothetical protein
MINKRQSAKRLAKQLRKSKSKKHGRLLLAPGLKLVGVGKRPDTSYSAVLRAKAIDGWTTVILPFEWLPTPSLIEKALVRVGYATGDANTAVGAIRKALNGENTLPKIAFTEGNGWRDEYRAYVFGSEVIGTPARQVVFPPTPGEATGEGHHLTMGRAPGGSWKVWQHGMTKAFRSSDVILSAVCFGLASTMASRIGVESGLVHFYGPSTGGKTLTLAIVWSMFGPCFRERLPNWNATPTGFEELLDVSTDSPYVCDELTFLSADSDAAKNLKNTSYAIASDRRRVRSKHWAGGSTSPVRSGRTFVLSTGEVSLDELTAKHAGSRRLGERCRAIDIDADMGNGSGVFNELPTGLDLATFARRIEAKCQANYGHAGHRFIKHLIEERDAWPLRARRAMNDFKREAKVSSAGYAGRFAERFAGACAAGFEARRCGILAVSEEQIRRALIRLYKRAAKSLPNPERDARRALSELKSELTNPARVLRIRPGKVISAKEIAQADIFRRKDPKLGTLFLIRPEILARLCGSKAAWSEAIRLLRQGGHLVSDGRNLPTRQVSIAGSDRKSRLVCIRKGFAKSA